MWQCIITSMYFLCRWAYMDIIIILKYSASVYRSLLDYRLKQLGRSQPNFAFVLGVPMARSGAQNNSSSTQPLWRWVYGTIFTCVPCLLTTARGRGYYSAQAQLICPTTPLPSLLPKRAGVSRQHQLCLNFKLLHPMDTISTFFPPAIYNCIFFFILFPVFVRPWWQSPPLREDFYVCRVKQNCIVSP